MELVLMCSLDCVVFEVPTAVTMKCSFFWDVTTRNLVTVDSQDRTIEACLLRVHVISSPEDKANTRFVFRKMTNLHQTKNRHFPEGFICTDISMCVRWVGRIGRMGETKNG
jgi:hypothetical protein